MFKRRAQITPAEQMMIRIKQELELAEEYQDMLRWHSSMVNFSIRKFTIVKESMENGGESKELIDAFSQSLMALESMRDKSYRLWQEESEKISELEESLRMITQVRERDLISSKREQERMIMSNMTHTSGDCFDVIRKDDTKRILMTSKAFAELASEKKEEPLWRTAMKY